MSRIPRPVSGLSRRPSRASSVVSEDDDVITVLSNGTSNLAIGDRVRLPGDKIGTLRYRGPTQFKPGEWAGVELDNRQGLNDGSVNDIRYFTCAHGHGIFVPIGCVKRIQSPEPYSFCNGYRPCSTTPSISGRNKSKSFAVSPAMSTTPVPNGRRQTFRRSNDRGNSLSSDFSNFCRLGGQRAMSMGNEHTAMLNAAVLERDKAVSMVDKLKRQVEDLEFQLEEEKARSVIEDKPNVANVECQADIECEELANLKSCCSRLTQMNRKLLESKRQDENSIKAMTTLCMKLEEYVECLENNTVPIETHKQMEERVKILEEQCMEYEKSNRILQREIHDVRKQCSSSIDESKRKIQDLEKHITSLEEEKLSSMGQQVMDLMAECHAKDDKIKQQSRIIEDLEAKFGQSNSLGYKSSFTSLNGTVPDSARYVGSDNNETYTSSSRVSSRYQPNSNERSPASRWYSTLNETLPNNSTAAANTTTNSTNSTLGTKKIPLNLFRSMRYP